MAAAHRLKPELLLVFIMQKLKAINLKLFPILYL